MSEMLLKRFHLFQDIQLMVGSQAVRTQDDPAVIPHEQVYVRQLSADIKIGVGAETPAKIFPPDTTAIPSLPQPLQILLPRIHIMHQQQGLITIKMRQITGQA